MSKERLEEIERIVAMHGGSIIFIKREYVNWLIEQAERVEWLDSEVDRKTIQSLNRFRELKDLVIQNNRYREALEYYRDNPLPLRGGSVAHKALEGDPHESS